MSAGAAVALYARVSTFEQRPENQLAELREYAARRGWTIAGEYVDHGISGVRESRPQLNRLMQDAHRRQFAAVLVWKIDRFGRSLKHLVNALAELEARKIAFVSLKDNLDLTTPSGRLMFGVIAAMAEFERCLIQERVRAGLKAARARGKRLGRPPAPVTLAQILELRSAGLSWRKLGQRLGVDGATCFRIYQRHARATGTEGLSLPRVF